MRIAVRVLRARSMLQSTEILEFQKSMPEEATAPLSPRLHGLQSLFVILICFSISLFVPLFLLLACRGHAAANGVALETGCHGPELPFGLLSGIMLLLLLRVWAALNEPDLRLVLRGSEFSQ